MAHAHQRGMSAFATTFGLIDWISGNWPRRTGKDAPRKRLWNTYPNLDVQVIKALQRWKVLSFLPVFWDCICICPCKVYMRNKIEYWDGPRIIPYIEVLLAIKKIQLQIVIAVGWGSSVLPPVVIPLLCYTQLRPWHTSQTKQRFFLRKYVFFIFLQSFKSLVWRS